MATPTKQQKRAKRAASKAKQNRMVRSGQAVKASAGDSASVEQSTLSGAKAAMLRWLWGSMNPGTTVRPPTSTNSALGGAAARISASDPTAAIRPLLAQRAEVTVSAASTVLTRALTIAMSRC